MYSDFVFCHSMVPFRPIRTLITLKPLDVLFVRMPVNDMSVQNLPPHKSHWTLLALIRFQKVVTAPKLDAFQSVAAQHMFPQHVLKFGFVITICTVKPLNFVIFQMSVYLVGFKIICWLSFIWTVFTVMPLDVFLFTVFSVYMWFQTLSFIKY